MTIYKTISAGAGIFMISFACTAFGSGKSCRLKIVNAYNREIEVQVEIADTDAARRRGLMYRRSLHADGGMLFIFSRERYRNFWMKNTYVPLSIAYIDKNGIIREIYNMKPLNISKTYPSRYPAKYALEVNWGWFNKKNIKKGNRIKFNGCFGK